MKTALILLAAGLSRRFGPEDKLLLELEGRPLYRHTLDKLEQLRDEDTRLLVMTNTPAIQDWCGGRGIPWGASPRAAEGISHTIRAALALAGEADSYVFFVSDQPRLRESTIGRLLECCRGSGAPLGCLSCGGRRGNPAWFSARFRPELEALSGDTGGRAVLQRHLEEAVLVPAAPEELEDIDLPLVTGGNLQYNRGRKTSE